MLISRRDLLNKMLKRIKRTCQAIAKPRNCRASFTARFPPEWFLEWAAHLEQLVRRCLPGINARFAVSQKSKPATRSYVRRKSGNG